MNDLPGQFANVRCCQCGLIRLSPRPTSEKLGSFYPNDTYYSYGQNSVSQETDFPIKQDIRRSVIASFGYPLRINSKLVTLVRPIINRFFLRRAAYGFGKRFPKYVPNGRALDIGCGSGVFLSILKQYGWNVRGLELKHAAADAAKEKFGIDVSVGDLADANFEEESFDYISFNHSLEHLPNIIEVLGQVKKLLKPDGLLYVEVPNANSLSQRISGKYWLHWDVPRHLYSFTPKTLKSLMRKTGFQDLKIETFRADFYLSDLRYRREEDLGFHFASDSDLPMSDRVHAHFLKILTDLYFLIYKQSGDYISCFARK
ncbi:MAG: class I SAM-dependent methyltransferase [Chloracidobacterium sp.]|nr:class I SAM-dependent methyltransferase [Chloracidobacterium sp.]